MTIEPLTASAVPEVAAIERLCFSDPWSEAAFEGELQNPLASYLVAKINGVVAGFVGIHRVLDEGYITNIATHPARRRAGVGRALLAALCEECERDGMHFVTLETRASNTAAITLYTGMGFRRAGLRRGYYRTPPEDAVLMTKFFY